MNEHFEAVQYREWGVWHAIRPEDTDITFCGRNAVTAKRMWERWADHLDHCQRCESALRVAS